MIRVKKPTKAPGVLQGRGMTAARQLCAAYDGDPSLQRHGRSISVCTPPNPSRPRCGRRNTTSAPSVSRRSPTSRTATSSIFDRRRDTNSGRTILSLNQVTTGLPTNGQIFCSAARSATNGIRGTSFRCSRTLGGRSHTTTTSRTNSRYSSIQPKKTLTNSSSSMKNTCAPTEGNQRGTVTIEVLGFNRELIAERRKDALAILKTLIHCRDLLELRVAKHPDPLSKNQIAAIDAQLDRCVSDSAEYAAMVRAVLKLRANRASRPGLGRLTLHLPAQAPRPELSS